MQIFSYEKNTEKLASIVKIGNNRNRTLRMNRKNYVCNFQELSRLNIFV